MKKKIVLILIAVLFLFTGCTKRFTLTNEDKTSKSYVSNIICQPATDGLRKIYIDNEDKTGIKLEDLPKCKDFSLKEAGYEDLWTSIFVKPLAWLVIKLGVLLKSYGFSIMIIALLLRAVLFPFSKKSTLLSENMKKAKPDLDKLEKKYKDKTDKNATMMKSQEMMIIYKKYNISPLSGCLFAFLQLPIFFAFLEAVYRVPVLFEGKFLIFNLGTTPWEAIKTGNYWYVILIILIIAATYFSMKNMNNQSMDEAQAKQMQMMNKFMIVFISFMSFTLPTAIALYWIVSSGFTIIQNVILKKSNLEPKKKKIKVKK